MNINYLLKYFNLKLQRRIKKDNIMDNDKLFIDFYDKCKDYTALSKERLFSLYKCVNYILDNNIKGDFVECGVYKGGAVMMIAYILKYRKIDDRTIWLYDTFKGMTRPSIKDKYIHNNEDLEQRWYKQQKRSYNEWVYSPVEEVYRNILKTDYDQFIFVQGDVCETLKHEHNLPKNISVLRLDTDFYDSTKSELNKLYPRLTKDGILIIDDYGTFEGCKIAVDEYFNNQLPYFTRTDETEIVIRK